MTDSKRILKIGAVILDDRRLLVVRKITPDNRNEFIIPGGRQEENESDLETLTRELDEELGIALREAKHFGSFDDIAVFENIPIHMEVYLTQTSGVPHPRSEIKEHAWIGRDYASQGYRLGSVLAKYVVPKLIKQGLM